MKILIKEAQTSSEIDEVFKLRYTVLVNEEKYLPSNKEFRIFDRFDPLPSSTNYIASINGQSVGTVRFTQLSKAGIPAERYFDYSQYLPHYDGRIICGSMLCVKKRYRKNSSIGKNLVQSGISLAQQKKLTYLLAPINPITKNFFIRLGFKAVGDEFVCDFNNLPTLPMLLKISEVNTDFQSLNEKIMERRNDLY